MIKPMKAYAVVCGDLICTTFNNEWAIYESEEAAQDYADDLMEGSVVAYQYKVIEVTIMAAGGEA